MAIPITYNDATLNGGDITDWASVTSPTQSGMQGLASKHYDAFGAVARPGYGGPSSDIGELAALGYALRTA